MSGRGQTRWKLSTRAVTSTIRPPHSVRRVRPGRTSSTRCLPAPDHPRVVPLGSRSRVRRTWARRVGSSSSQDKNSATNRAAKAAPSPSPTGARTASRPPSPIGAVAGSAPGPRSDAVVVGIGMVGAPRRSPRRGLRRARPAAGNAAVTQPDAGGGAIGTPAGPGCAGGAGGIGWTAGAIAPGSHSSAPPASTNRAPPCIGVIGDPPCLTTPLCPTSALGPALAANKPRNDCVPADCVPAEAGAPWAPVTSPAGRSPAAAGPVAGACPGPEGPGRGAAAVPAPPGTRLPETGTTRGGCGDVEP